MPSAPRADAARGATSGAELVSTAYLRDWRLPEPTGGKEARGRVLVVGGSRETLGGLLLAAEAAMRAGAGKLQVATAASVAGHAGVALPEALVRGLPETPAGAVRAEAADDVADLAQDASVVLVGPGLGDVEQAGGLLARLLPSLRRSVVVDALALAGVTQDDTCLHHLGRDGGGAVLTPNPGELALTLRRDEVADDDVPAAAAELASRTRAVVAVGGAASWVCAPDGRVWLDRSGGAGLGVSGSGDVRAGVVAGLLARGAEPAQAAVWGSHLHGRAGERLAASVGKLGFLARELPPEVPRVLAEVDL